MNATGDLLGEYIRRRDDILGGMWLSNDAAAAARQLRAELGPTAARQWAASVMAEMSRK